MLKVEFWLEHEDDFGPISEVERAPRWLRDVEHSVNRLMEDLDRAGQAVHFDVVVACFQLLARVMAHDTIAPTIVPRFDGGLQLEWHVNQVDLEVSFDDDGTKSAWCEHASGREWEDESGELNIGRLRKELSLLTNDG